MMKPIFKALNHVIRGLCCRKNMILNLLVMSCPPVQ